MSDEAPGLVVDNYVDYKFHEIDEYNIAKMGRRWFGDRFDFENEKTFDFEFSNLITQESLNISVHAAAVSQANSSMTVELNVCFRFNEFFCHFKGEFSIKGN